MADDEQPVRINLIALGHLDVGALVTASRHDAQPDSREGLVQPGDDRRQRVLGCDLIRRGRRLLKYVANAFASRATTPSNSFALALATACGFLPAHIHVTH
jgi:hypothetical protein